MESYITEMLMNGATGMLEPLINEIFKWLILCYIPFFALGVAKCFFGYKIFRVLLTIEGAVNGLVLGGLFGILVYKDNINAAGIIIFAIIGAAVGGIFSWFCYKICMCLLTLFNGFYYSAVIIMLLFKSVTAGISIGVVIGAICAVFCWIYLDTVIIVYYSITGAVSIGAFVSLLFKYSMPGCVVGIIIFMISCVLGYMVQNSYYNDGIFKLGSIKFQLPFIKGNRQPAKIVEEMPLKCQLIGIEGKYKGFEFDVDEDITLGRDEERCNIIFPQDSNGVSRVQCTIIRNKEMPGLSVCDKYSSYGTSVNGRKINTGEVVPLNNGDILLFGENNVFKIKY